MMRKHADALHDMPFDYNVTVPFPGDRGAPDAETNIHRVNVLFGQERPDPKWFNGRRLTGEQYLRMRDAYDRDYRAYVDRRDAPTSFAGKAGRVLGVVGNQMAHSAANAGLDIGRFGAWLVGQGENTADFFDRQQRDVDNYYDDGALGREAARMRETSPSFRWGSRGFEELVGGLALSGPASGVKRLGVGSRVLGSLAGRGGKVGAAASKALSRLQNTGKWMSSPAVGKGSGKFLDRVFMQPLRNLPRAVASNAATAAEYAPAAVGMTVGSPTVRHDWNHEYDTYGTVNLWRQLRRMGLLSEDASRERLDRYFNNKYERLLGDGAGERTEFAPAPDTDGRARLLAGRDGYPVATSASTGGQIFLSRDNRTGNARYYYDRDGRLPVPQSDIQLWMEPLIQPTTAAERAVLMAEGEDNTSAAKGFSDSFIHQLGGDLQYEYGRPVYAFDDRSGRYRALPVPVTNRDGSMRDPVTSWRANTGSDTFNRFTNGLGTLANTITGGTILAPLYRAENAASDFSNGRYASGALNSFLAAYGAGARQSAGAGPRSAVRPGNVVLGSDMWFGPTPSPMPFIGNPDKIPHLLGNMAAHLPYNYFLGTQLPLSGTGRAGSEEALRTADAMLNMQRANKYDIAGAGDVAPRNWANVGNPSEPRVVGGSGK